MHNKSKKQNIQGRITLHTFMHADIHLYLHYKQPTKSNGKRRSEMKICGSERDRNLWLSRYCGESGAGSDTPSGSQHPAPHAKL